MSIATAVFEGLRRAAAYSAMLFSLGSPAPTPAQPPNSEPAAPPASLAIEGAIGAAGVTLAAHHVDVRIADGRASVQTLLRLRNDTTADVAFLNRLPWPARLLRGDAAEAASRADAFPARDEGDLTPEAAELAETSTPRTLRAGEVIVLAPAEEVTVEVLRELPLASRGNIHRLQLPLPVDRDAPWVPRFTADVLVESDRPIRRLASPTHRARVDGLGSGSAQLSVPGGFVYRQSRFVVEFELQPGDHGALALDERAGRIGR